jgi:hypothetical protein
MPVELKGALETIKAMRKFDPDLLKEMNKEIRGVMVPMRDKARGYAPSPQPDNLYGWAEGSVGKKITKRNSAFRQFNVEGRVRLFPLYDHKTVVAGIKYSQAPPDVKTRVEILQVNLITRALALTLLTVWVLCTEINKKSEAV